jgi:hypothetical protein
MKSASRERLKPISAEDLAEVAGGAGQRLGQATERRLGPGRRIKSGLRVFARAAVREPSPRGRRSGRLRPGYASRSRAGPCAPVSSFASGGGLALSGVFPKLSPLRLRGVRSPKRRSHASPQFPAIKKKGGTGPPNLVYQRLRPRLAPPPPPPAPPPPRLLPPKLDSRGLASFTLMFLPLSSASLNC